MHTTTKTELGHAENKIKKFRLITLAYFSILSLEPKLSFAEGNDIPSRKVKEPNISTLKIQMDEDVPDLVDTVGAERVIIQLKKDVKDRKKGIKERITALSILKNFIAKRDGYTLKEQADFKKIEVEVRKVLNRIEETSDADVRDHFESYSLSEYMKQMEKDLVSIVRKERKRFKELQEEQDMLNRMDEWDQVSKEDLSGFDSNKGDVNPGVYDRVKTKVKSIFGGNKPSPVTPFSKSRPAE